MPGFEPGTCWGSLKAKDVRKRDVVKLLDEYRDQGKGVASNRLAVLISTIYNVGIDRDTPGVLSNPASKLVERDFERVRTRVLSDEELRVLVPLFKTEGLAGLGFRLVDRVDRARATRHPAARRLRDREPRVGRRHRPPLRLP